MEGRVGRLVAIERFGEKIERTEFRRFDRRLDVSVTGDHDDRQFIVPVSDFRKHFNAVHAGHLYIKHDYIGQDGFYLMQSQFSIFCKFNFIMFVFKYHLQRISNAFIIIDDKNGFHVMDSFRKH